MVVFYFCINMYHRPSRQAYLPGGGLPVVMMAGDPRGSRLLHWARPWSAVIPGELHSCCLYRIIFYRGGVACGPPNTTINNHEHFLSNLSQHNTLEGEPTRERNKQSAKILLYFVNRSRLLYTVLAHSPKPKCVFFPFILDFNGRTSRGHTGRR